MSLSSSSPVRLRRVAVFTGNRAEYGLQYPVLKALSRDPRLEPLLIVGGTHLQKDFGGTLKEISEDGFKVHAHVATGSSHGSLRTTADAIGTTILGMAARLEELQPDILVVYGDRFEAFGAMIAATQMGIPTAHIEGGDYTEGGALDDSVRHSMTKLAHLHFATNRQAVERILRLGEESWRVFDVGLPSLDTITESNFASVERLRVDLGLDPARPVVLFCQHSVATEYSLAAEQVRPSLEALRMLAAEGWQVLITYPNNDAGGVQIVAELESMRSAEGVTVVESLGRYRFHGVLNLIGRVGRGCLAGNSSAGIKETPVFGCPAVNIGSRQQGRLRAGNVLDTLYDAGEIYEAIRRCADDFEFRARCRGCRNPYGSGNAGVRIAEVLATMPLGPNLLRKRMTY